MGGAEVAIGSEQLALGLLGPMAGHEVGVRSSQGEAPGRGRMAPGDLHHHFQEDAGLQLQAAEHFRRHDLVEAGLGEGLVHLVRHPAHPIAGGLPFEQLRPKSAGRLDQFVLRWWGHDV